MLPAKVLWSTVSPFESLLLVDTAMPTFRTSDRFSVDAMICLVDRHTPECRANAKTLQTSSSRKKHWVL